MMSVLKSGLKSGLQFEEQGLAKSSETPLPSPVKRGLGWCSGQPRPQHEISLTPQSVPLP